MAFYTSKEINLTLNGRALYANSVSLSQEASLTSPFLEGELISDGYVPNSPVASSLKINYYLTGVDYLKDLILLNHRKNITGNVGGVSFSDGYLESYSLNAEPNSPVLISASIKICDELAGTFASSNPSYFPRNLSLWNFNDAYFNLAPNYSAVTTNNITKFTWDYSADVSPVYYANQTGLSRINADRVVIGEKNISCSISCDNTQIPLSFTGENYAVELVCQSPDKSINETYGISGRISKKAFNIPTNSIAESVYSINQSHVNEEPTIAVVNTSLFVSNNTIEIQSSAPPHKYITQNNSYSTILRITLGGQELNTYTMTDGSSSTVTVTMPLDAINGYLNLETTKGMVQYPTPLNLSFPAITVTGFTPITGAEHCLVSISGLNFYRVSDVRINNKSCVFDVVDTTGAFHRINAYVPNSPTIGKVSVHSMLRNVSGFSTGNFYPAMEITSFNPATGTWSGIVTLSGRNFTGITNVYFNGIRSPNFTVNNNQQITARTPMTGQGFAKGYISISGIQGGVARSRTIYRPILKITGVSLLQGTPDNDIRLSGLFDSGSLYFENGGYRVAFGDEYSIFMRSGNVGGAGGSNFILTGYVPLANFSSAAPAMIEPDGVTRYDKFTGQFIQIGKPVINTVNGAAITMNFALLDSYTLTLGGENLNYLFGTPYSVILSGDSYSHSAPEPLLTKSIITTYAGSDIVAGGDGTTLQVLNVRMTGNIFKEYVWSRIGVVNFAGTGWFPYALKFNSVSSDSSIKPTPRIPTVATNFQDLTLFVNGTSNPGTTYPASNVIAAVVGEYAASYTNRFGATWPLFVDSSSGWIDYHFNPVINFGGIYIEQKTNMPTSDAVGAGWSRIPNQIFNAPFGGNGTYTNANTGVLLFYQGAGEGNLNIVARTGIIFSTSETGPTKLWPNNNIITGVRKIRLFRNDDPILQPLTQTNSFIGLSHILFYD